jgi:hypothetical protein
VRVLLTASCVLSCGRIGFGLLEEANDAGTQGGSQDGGPGADATASATGPSSDDGAARDASSPGDTSADVSLPEAQADAGPYPSCSSIAIRWDSTFTSDPTSGDGGPDWAVRGGGAFPVGELDGAVWWSAMQTPIDTRPLDDFSHRVIADVRFLNATVSASNRGAVFWINVNEDGPQFSALFASTVAQSDGGQALTLFGKPDAAAEAPIVTFSNLPSTFIDLHLDVDPTTLQVGLWIDQTFRGTYSFPPTGAPNADHFATLLSWTGLSGFASVSVVECAN